ERLGEERGTQLLHFPEHALVAFGGQHDHGETPRGGGGPQLPQQVEARAIGEVEIEQHGVEGGVAVLQRRARLGERPREAHAIAEPLEMGAQQQPDVRLVVDDEEVPPGGRQRGPLPLRGGWRSRSGGGAGRRAARPRWWTVAPAPPAARRRGAPRPARGRRRTRALRHRMTPRRRLVAVTAVVTGLALLAAACSNSMGLPAAFFPNAVDTVSLYALRGTAITLPSAYSIQDRSTVRTDTTVNLDFAFD